MKKILLLVAGGWISFMNQGRGLQAALHSRGIAAELLFAGNKPSDLTHTPDLTPYRDHVVITVGSWQDYGRLIAPALAAGCQTLPWLVSDAAADRDIVVKLNQLPLILTTSRFCYDIFVRDGIQPGKLRILYEAVDEDIWKPATEAQQTAFLDYVSIDEEEAVVTPSSFNLRRAKAINVPILLTVGGDATSKGALETIAALHKLGPQLPWLWIIKTLPYVYSFQGSIEQYEQLGGLAARVKFIVGEFSQLFLLGLMNICDIYVAPSRGEGFGLPLVEAQLCGKMVITHDATSTREVIVEGKTGLVSTHHSVSTADVKGSMRADIDSLAEQLRRTLTDQTLRRALSEQARPITLARFGKSAIADQFMIYVNQFTS